MEGLPIWFYAAVVAIFGLMWLSLIPVFAAVGLLVVRRPRLALRSFAAASLSEAILGSAFCLVLYFGLGSKELDLALVFGGLSLLLAGVGQFVAAFRDPRAFILAFLLAVTAAVVVWLNAKNPDWRGLAASVSGLAFALASLTIGVFFSSQSRRLEPDVVDI